MDFSALTRALVDAARLANALPQDIQFHRALDRDLAAGLDATALDILDVGNALILAARPAADAHSYRPYEDVEDIVENYGRAVDAVDALLEKADAALDEMTGKGRNAKAASVAPTAPVIVSVAAAKSPTARSSRLAYSLIHAQNIARPQLVFDDPVDNSHTPFRPLIREKPNALVPLNHGWPSAASQQLDDSQRLHMQSLGISDHIIQAPHPYEVEIRTQPFPAGVMETRKPEPYVPLADMTPIWVDTDAALDKMIRALASVSEIAVDLEAHNLRSYQGFTCLMQISTRSADYLVDTLKLRSSIHRINRVFTAPHILKVFHGAESDIQWLQRDFGVYVVSLFDTYHAAKVLEMSGFSLAHLLEHFCGVSADKRYQLADWRIRPLPTEMLAYAQSDTHFLLYIYDRLRNDLLARSAMNDELVAERRNLVQLVLGRSRDTCLRRYEKDRYDAETGEGPGGWRNTLLKWRRAVDSVKLAVFKAVHAWRDQVARDEDESVRYVLSNSQMFALVERMPIDAPGVLGCCQPASPIMRMYAQDVALLITRAAEEERKRQKAVAKATPLTPTAPIAARHVRFDAGPDEPMVAGEEVMDEPEPSLPSEFIMPQSRLFGEALREESIPTDRIRTYNSIMDALRLDTSVVSLPLGAKLVAAADGFETVVGR